MTDTETLLLVLIAVAVIYEVVRAAVVMLIDAVVAHIQRQREGK
jgi:hypothetical protein